MISTALEAAVNFDIKPLENFSNKITLGLDYRKNEERQFVPKNQVLLWSKRMDFCTGQIGNTYL